MIFGRGRTPSSARPYQPDFITENDVVIAIMGPTGVGKSSFVNKAAGRREAVVGNSLTSQTRRVHPVRCQHPDGTRNVVLVDTPGFDDTHLSDSQILRIIANWLKETYQNNIKLAGLLYLHRISDVRMAGTPLRNLSVFKDLCGAGNMKNVILVTTMWDEVEDDKLIGEKREEQLMSDFWKDMISLGSRTRRFEGTLQSAWDILDCLDLKPLRPTLAPLQIQEEMVDRNMPFQETAAARTLLRSIAAEFKKVLKRVLSGARRGSGSKKSPNNRSRSTLSSSSTPRSAFSMLSWSAVSLLSNTSSITSRDSEDPPSLSGSTSLGCSANGRLNNLPTTITALRLAHEMADIASIPVLRGPIRSDLHMAQRIEKIGGTHHTIVLVLECSGLLLEEIAQYSVESKLSKDVKKLLASLKTQLDNLQSVVEAISSRNPVAPFFLQDADIQVITECIASIKQIYDKPELTKSLFDRQAATHLNSQLSRLANNPILQKCECGISVVREED